MSDELHRRMTGGQSSCPVHGLWKPEKQGNGSACSLQEEWSPDNDGRLDFRFPETKQIAWHCFETLKLSWFVTSKMRS